MHSSARSSTYTPSDRSQGVLVSVLRDHLDELVERIAVDSGRRLPRFVEQALRAMLTCGDLDRGFVRLRCRECRAERVIPFSCKTKLCSTCSGRVMNERAAYMVDRVLRGDIRWRQYVITFPAPLAVGLCFRRELAAAVTRLAVRVLFEHQRRRAASGTPGVPRPAAVVWLQRFSDGAGCWLHLHVLAPDGVFRQLPNSLDAPFERQPPPRPDEVTSLCRRIARRATALIRAHALTEVDDALLERCAAQPAVPVRTPTPPPARARRPSPLQADYEGFSLHAATSAAPNCPEQLERLVRYVGRPPIPSKRLRRLPDGRVVFRLRRPRRGVTEFVFEPLAFLARVAALVPIPMQNQVLYFGAVSPASPIRSAVLPEPPQPTKDRPVAPTRPQRMSFADLLRRVYRVDLLTCPCGGRFTQLSVIQDPDVVQAILAAIILSNQTPSRAPPTRQKT